MREEQIIPVGARILVRDAEWRVLASDAVREGGYRLKCVGLSELVRGKQSIFLTMFEDDITILKPEETLLIQDRSRNFEKSKLYLEALIRTAPLTDDSKICVAHHAAMDALPYQFNPALQALSQPRARILIADAVGIGKTLEAGILASELIARGRGKRILVVATKSVLQQFQREFWNRFSIPLTRLDSTGIQRVRNRIPTNHNPFHYFDKAIISIDTLKRDLEYRNYLEHAYWDIIIIDEAHNVAERSSNSQRANLAKLLADRSDTMIMLSATPHDGKSESFASLLNILDATAIVNPHDYKPEDFANKGLVIRRFKHHIRDQVKAEFPDRKVEMREVSASDEENAVYDYLSHLTFKTLDQKKATGAQLFSTTLTKAMFSSPRACISVIENRLTKLRKAKAQEAKEDIAKLEKLLTLVKKVKTNQFSKFKDLVDALSDGPNSIHWTRNSDDRLVIFTESIKTMEFLGEELPKQLKLKADQYKTLSGAMKDTEIPAIVNEFNNGQSPMRLLICSDVASEGLNLHHFAHRMIHFDIPWSLLVFQQRNGRIDRYGQEKQPQIFYLQTIAKNVKSRGDARVLQRLQEKDERAQTNLDDPAEFLGTQQEQEDRTAAEIEGHPEPIEKPENDLIDIFFNGSDEKDNEEGSVKRSLLAPVLSSSEYKEALTERGMIFESDMDFGSHALDWLNRENDWDKNVYKNEGNRIFLQAPEDLLDRMKYLPVEVLPKDARFDLTDDTKAIQNEMQYVLSVGQEWPSKQLFWAQHPVMKWIEDRLQNAFGRHSAPVLPLKNLVDERWVLLQGGYPNRRGYIPVHRWIAVREKGGKFSTHTLKEMVDALNLKSKLTNSAATLDTAQFGSFVKKAVVCATKALAEAKTEFEKRTIPKLKKQRDDLKALQDRHIKQMELDFGGLLKPLREERERKRRNEIEEHFRSAENYIEETATLQDEPYLQLVALFCPANR